MTETDCVFLVPLIHRAIILGCGHPPAWQGVPCPDASTVPNWEHFANSLLTSCLELQNGAQHFIAQNMGFINFGQLQGYITHEVQVDLMDHLNVNVPAVYSAAKMSRVFDEKTRVWHSPTSNI